MELVKKIGKFLSWGLLLFSLASIGFIADFTGEGNPAPETKGRMVVWYGLFFALCFAGVHLFIRRHKRHTMSASPHAFIIKKSLGAVMAIGSLFIPSIAFASAGFSAGIHATISGITLVLVVIGAIAIQMMNKSKVLGIVAYLLLIGLSLVPGFIMMQHDNSYNALGMAYYAAIFTAVFAWTGLSLFSIKKEV